ncbi:MAG: multidrug efflux RND transporter permease subunit [Pseudomonadota bacterium]|nr:multidrug efflux RND transporter permease subunit [Pseudomonadota bacterium]
MDFSRFFVDRPIFAAVISTLIFLAGLLALPLLPISEYPDVVPPSVQVRAVYPGANPKTIAETVASPLEEAINGVENMIYMKSIAGSDGVLQINVTFKGETDIDKAQVEVQNRVAQALPRLPEDVRRLGVSTIKSSPNLTMVVHLISPDGRYDANYLRNYATLRVKDELSRLDGVGQALAFGGGDYAMRIWLDPEKVAARGLNAGEVVNAIREQNVQVSAGQLGAPPSDTGVDFTTPINAVGRLSDESEFGDIIIKTGDLGETTRLKDVARIELGAADYTLRSLLDNKQAAAIAIFQAPGSNSIALSDAVRARMKRLSRVFPDGVKYDVVYDPTVFVRDSIKEVVKTLLEAILFVVLVVILFLQNWRASIIPLIAVPVSIIGTFAVLLALGFSINVLTLFGMVLAIGIVVDDAIVVVENVERNIGNGLSPLAAAHQAMREVSGPIIAIAIVLCAVFIPIAFLSGVTGQFYRQFAVTIAISTVISAINSLTLSPALAAVLLKSHGARKDRLQRGIDATFGWLFRPFNRFFKRASDGYAGMVDSIVTHRGVMFVIYALLIVLTFVAFRVVPSGFIPVQDKQYLFGIVQLPAGATIDRTETAIRKMSDLALATEGIESAVAFPGLNGLQFTNTPNQGVIFFGLDPFHKRDRKARDIVGELNQKLGTIREGFAIAFEPPPVLGLGNGNGYSLMIQDRNDAGYGQLHNAVTALQGQLFQTPGFLPPISSYQVNVPQFDAVVDRTKIKDQGLTLSSVYETLQVYFGSQYVNDFNRFGRTYQVIAQADAPFRDQPEDIEQLRVRNAAGQMVPISTLVTLKQSYGPDPVIRYNGYLAADLTGETIAAMMSSNEAIEALSKIMDQSLPRGMAYEWTDLSYEQVNQGDTSMIVFPICVLLVFLALAALYESWSLPMAVILIVPMCMLSAVGGIYLTNMGKMLALASPQMIDNDIFVQVGLVLLMGLACKNAILIVEFARELERQGKSVVDAALEACRLRLRPILMTSFAFIMGVIPLVFTSGAGAEIRHVMGVTVFSGMLGVTLFGLVLTPAFYVAIRTLVKRREAKAETEVAHV